MSLYIIDRQSGHAVYKQISLALQKEISRHYEPGDMLPPEHTLARHFSVNRHTVRRAIDELVSLGILERQHGKGTFILSQVEYNITSKTRFTENINQSGLSSDSRVLRKARVMASAGVCRWLDLQEGSEVVWIETLREVNSIPFCIISHFLPLPRFQAVLDHYNYGSLHAFIESALDISIQRKESLITAVLPQGEDAKLLQMPVNQPVLRSKSLNTDAVTGDALEYAVTRFRSDRAQLRIDPIIHT